MIQLDVEVQDITKNYKNPIAELVQTACQFDSRVTLQSGGKTINAKSIMGIMAFNLVQGAKVSIQAEGSDEEQAAKIMEEYLTCK